MSTFRKGSALVVLVALVALVAAVSAFGGSAQQTATTGGRDGRQAVRAEVHGVQKTILKGIGVFKVTNKGKLGHNFKVNGKKTVVARAPARPPRCG